MDFYKAATLRDEILKLGDLLDRTELRDQYLEWYNQYVDEISKRVAEIPEENKTRVFIDGGKGKTFCRRAYSTGTGMHDLCVCAGGVNIAEGYVEGYADVEIE